MAEGTCVQCGSAGIHPCHWCRRPVAWDEAHPQSMDALVADHLDGDKTNNVPENLVPSCGMCNWNRPASQNRDYGWRKTGT